MKDIKNNEQVIQDIIDLFTKLGPEMHCKSDLISTEIVKENLTKLGFDYGFESRPNKIESEFLFDFTWYKKSNNEFQSIESVALILESEWKMNFTQIKYDFEKLLIANVQFKVIVFQADDVFENITIKLKNIINSFNCIDTNVYIFAGFVNSIGNFQVETYIKKLSNNCFNLIIPFVMKIAVATLGNFHANPSLRSGRNYRLSKC